MTAPIWPATAGPQDPDVITGSGPWGPRVDDPTGLTYDRADDEPTTTATAGDGWHINGRATTGRYDDPAPVSQPLGVPVHPLPAFNLRGLHRAGLTAVDWERIERASLAAKARATRPDLTALANLVETHPDAMASAQAAVADVHATIARYGRGGTGLREVA